jgi:hypothetical protein
MFSGPVEAEEGTSVLSQRAGSSEISWRILFLAKKTKHRHHAGFEPQCAQPFIKRVKAPIYPEKPFGLSGLNDGPSFCAILYTAGGIGELYQRRSSLV